jgi:hypothetical protein
MPPDAATTTPPVVFVSYSHQDKKYLAQLRVFLKPLERGGAIQCWDDTRIDAGGLWKREIADAIAAAAAAVLLVSADFLASDFIAKNELPPLLEAAERRGLAVLPVIVRPCGFEHTPSISKFQAVNDPSRPLAMLPGWRREKVWTKLTAYVQSTISIPRDETAKAPQAPSADEQRTGSGTARLPVAATPMVHTAKATDIASRAVGSPAPNDPPYHADSRGFITIPDGTLLYKGCLTDPCLSCQRPLGWQRDRIIGARPLSCLPPAGDILQ